MPSNYPFDDNTDQAFPKQPGYHIRIGPLLEQSLHSEITYLRKIEPTVTMTKSTFMSAERNVSQSIPQHIVFKLYSIVHTIQKLVDYSIVKH